MGIASMQMFQALPPIFGGKRRLLGHIFRELPRPSEAPVLADAFLGGGSVSLYAKARGYRVLCNDIAQRSALVGRALIANDRTTLAPEDVLRLFAPDEGNTGFIEERLSPGVVTRRHARFLDNALPVARRAEEPKRSLLLLLLVKYLYAQRPMGNFGAKSIIAQLDDGCFDEVNPSFLRGPFLGRVHAHPKRLCEPLRRQVNQGVFAGAARCEAHQQNVFAFLAGVEADVAVLDPPYAGTLDYSTALRAVDEMLAGEVVTPERSVFSSDGWSAALDRLFEAAAHIPVWALTFGNVATDLDALVAQVRRHRPHVTAQAIDYAHLSSLASEASRARNQELIVIARSEA